MFAGRTPERGTLGTLLQQSGLAPEDAAVRRAVIEDLVVVPHYDQLRQFGLDAMAVRGSWAFKLEALARRLRDDDSLAAVAGVEYTLGDVAGSGAALGLVAERLHDQRDDILVRRFDDEWFAGLRLLVPGRHAVNALLGLLADDRGRDRLLQLEFGLDPARNWRLLGKLRTFDKVPGDELGGFLRDEDLVSLTVVRYF